MRTSHKRILVVSDRPIRKRIAVFLREEGYDALSTDATAARESEIRNFEPDLILLDHLCDGFDSFSLYRILRRLEPDRPVLIVTLNMPPDYYELTETVAWVLRDAKNRSQRRRRRLSESGRSVSGYRNNS